jgi:hypothetical protein
MSQKISQLPNVIAANIRDTDILPIVATNITSKVTVANLRTKLGTQPPAGGRTVTDSFTYLTNNAVFNVKDFGAFGDGVTNDTAAFAAARAAQVVAGGGVIRIPKGTYLVDYIPTLGNVPVVIEGEGQASLVQMSGAVTKALVIGNTTELGIAFSRLENFAINGTTTNLGGIDIGTATVYTTYTKLRNVQVTGFTGVGAYGIALNTVQELEIVNCRLQGNYDNYYRPPALGYVTSAVIKGYAGYIGLATNRGVNLQGSVSDLEIREQVLESNAKAAIYHVGPTPSFLIIDDNYFEDNNNALGDSGVVTLSGSAAAYGAMRAIITRNRWHETSRPLSLDRVEKSVVGWNLGLEGGIYTGWTTANSRVHFQDNAGVGAADYLSLYNGLLGTITAEDIDGSGRRIVIGERYYSWPQTFAGHALFSGTSSVKPRGLSTTTPAPAIDTSGENAGAGLVIANNATADIGAQVSNGFLEIGETASIGTAALVWLRGAMQIIWQSAANFSLVAATAGKINVYNSGGRIIVENKTGGSISLYGMIRKAGA